MKKSVVSMILAIAMSICVVTLFAQENAEDVDAEGYKTAASAGMVFKWKIEGNQLKCVIKANTSGWLAVGFNSGRSMDKANLIIGYMDKKGNVVVQDHFGKKHGHKKDKIQNVIDVFGNEHVGNTELRFTIPLDSGDKEDFVLKPGLKYNVILATSDKDNLKTRHKKYASVIILL